MKKRVFLIVLDSLGIGELPDANDYGDEGSNTLRAIAKEKSFHAPRLGSLGLFNIDGVDYGKKEESPLGTFGRLAERSAGKDTTIGHWEIAGLISKDPLPTYPRGFPAEVLDKLTEAVGRRFICNKPYSGTEVIRDYGQEHVETGALILYTSADSVAQIAAHERIIPIKELYEICEKARKVFSGVHGVGRIIARPFEGEHPNFKRTANRHDFSLLPPGKTILNKLQEKGFDTISVGKIYDIFAGSGIGEHILTKSNREGMDAAFSLLEKDFNGLCFINLVDFDMLYGHRNDAEGYGAAVSEFDAWLEGFMAAMRESDTLIITADHGCDPSTPSTDHSREYVPLLIYGSKVAAGENLGTKESFAYVSHFIEGIF